MTTSGSSTRRASRKLHTRSEEEIEAAALSDPDAQPLTAEDLQRMKRTPRAKIIRRAFGLTQEQFASCFRIPIGTVRDWEQGISEPDAAARAYLIVIAADPIGVCRAFIAAPSPEERRAVNHSNLGLVHQAKGELAEAEAQYRKALVLAKAIGDKQTMADQLAKLAGLYGKRGDSAKASRHWRKARDLFSELKMPEMVRQADRALS
jgi:putative transcriptional regulator